MLSKMNDIQATSALAYSDGKRHMHDNAMRDDCNGCPNPVMESKLDSNQRFNDLDQ